MKLLFINLYVHTYNEIIVHKFIRTNVRWRYKFIRTYVSCYCSLIYTHMYHEVIVHWSIRIRVMELFFLDLYVHTYYEVIVHNFKIFEICKKKYLAMAFFCTFTVSMRPLVSHRSHASLGPVQTCSLAPPPPDPLPPKAVNLPPIPTIGLGPGSSPAPPLHDLYWQAGSWPSSERPSCFKKCSVLFAH